VDAPTVTVELYGTARHLAGVATVNAQGLTIADVLRSLAGEYRRLEGIITPESALSPRFLVSIDGERFVSDLTLPLPAGSRLIVLGADSGG
jgi:hypothetical protein